MVEPFDVGHRRELDVIKPAPWCLPADEFPLVELVETFSERIVVTVTSGTDLGNDVDLDETFRVTHAEVLHAAVAAMYQL